MQEPIPFRGRYVKPRPIHTFKDSGYQVELHALGPATFQRVAEIIRKEAKELPEGHEHKLPEPPIELIDIGGEMREERNEGNSTYLQALQKWTSWAANEMTQRMLRIAAVGYIEPIGITSEEIHQIAERRRRLLRAEGLIIPHFDQYDDEENDRIVWLLHEAVSTKEELNEFYAALSQRSIVREEAVHAHIATFPTAEQPNGNGSDLSE